MPNANDPLGPPIPTKLPLSVQQQLDDLVGHTRIDRSKLIRAAVTLLLEEVKRRGNADWVVDEIEGPKTPFPFAKGPENPKKTPPKQKRTSLRDILEVSLPLGDAPAGIPSPGQFRPDSWEESVSVRAKDFPMAAYALRIHGNSMTGRGIYDRDILIFALPERREPKTGDVVVAVIDGEVTVKTLIKRNGKATLRAENPAYPDPVVTKNSAVQGVMLGALKAPRSKQK